MYLRHSRIKKNGKSHTYWRLVRSVRVGDKVRQETVAHLGELDAPGVARASALAKHFLGEQARQLELFEDKTPLEPASVNLNRVRVENGRTFGGVWLAWKLWQVLELEKFCRSVLPRGKEDVGWSEIAAILVLARFCEPSSELHIAEDWYRRVALEDILGVRVDQVHHTRLYKGLDKLLPHKTALEKHLKDRLGTLFAIEYDLLLYDITSTYFEGSADSNPMAHRGYSRDHRPDCKQVCIGLVVTRDGYPLGYEIFAGNRTDVTTVEEMVEVMESRYGKADRVWVMDRGMTSEANLEWLREGGRRYLVGTPKSEMKKWERELLERDGWSEVREGLEVKICQGPGASEVFLLCRSAARELKEAAMLDRFSKRITIGLESLERRLAKGRVPADRSQVERQIGRLLERNRRASGKFEVRVTEDPAVPSGLRMQWKERSDWSDWARLTHGTYVLRSNVTDWTPEELWRTYVQLSEAEAAFRIQKSDLKIRPIWHQKQERVEAHILVCFLAFAMWKTLEGWQKRARLGSSPRTIIEEMGRISCVDVVLPLDDGTGEVRLRCVTRPDDAQAIILDRMGLRLPERLKPIPLPAAECSANH